MMGCALVTGATGFIGGSLVRTLDTGAPQQTPSVIGVGSRDADLADRRATFELFERISRKNTCSRIFHLAALYKAGGWPTDHPATQFHVNMGINVNVLEAWRRFFPNAKMTAVLSYCMYPPAGHAHPETELWGTEPEEYLYSYAMTKKALLVGLRAYRQEYGLACTSVVLPTVYGPGDRFSEDSHVMGALIGKFTRAHLRGAGPVEVWGDASQEREFLYIDDAVEGILRAAEKSDELVQNLGTGCSTSISTIVRCIVDATGYEGDIVYNRKRFVGVKKRLLDVGRMWKVLDWRPKTTLEEGIRATVAWYRSTLSAGDCSPC
ncbi:MAG: NAD-dependent epimerase/dehydratase family protein [Chitinivibrionales bacterium]|nr:NAD-dependent epimerase/dehydratase family protein [Chitinivibrionales bacterium]MBD3396792.1 NAD-dependent epimerase/dehydratase family protein [Chitinivibrionales bacterium]